MLINHFCVKKASDLVVEKSWFDEAEQTAYIRFNQPVNTANSSLSTNLKVEVLDFDDNPFLDYKDLNLSLVADNSILRVQLRILRSIYNSRITIVQTSEKSILYNGEMFMDVKEKMTVEDVRFITTDVPNKIISRELQIQRIVWITMVSTVVLGSVAHAWAGTLVMRTISLFSTLSNMNGNFLHISDTFFDVVSSLSSPFNFDRVFEKDQSTTRCKPLRNFRKRRNAYWSCNILDLSLDSILTFLSCSLVPLMIYVFFATKMCSHRRKQRENNAYIASSSVVFWSIINGFFGPRLLVLVFEAASPTLLKHSFLTVTSTDDSKRMLVGSVLGWTLLAGHMLLQFMLFRFTNNFLDLQHLKQLKFLPSKQQRKKVNLEPLISNKVYPKKDLPIIRRPFPKAENVVPELSKDVDDSGIGLAPKETPAGPLVFDPIVVQDEMSVDTRKAVYPVMNCFIERFKKFSLSKTYQLFYYLALFELIQCVASQFVLVRFSGDGIIQIYLISLFELLVTGFTLFSNPFRQVYDLLLYSVYKLLVLGVYTLKMLNFSDIDEQATRQDKLDIAVLFVGVSLLGYSMILGAGSIAFGIKTLFQYQKLKKVQMALFELDKKDLIANLLHDSTVIPVKINIPQPKTPEPPAQQQFKQADSPTVESLQLDFLQSQDKHKRSAGSDEGLVDSKEESPYQKHSDLKLSPTNMKQKRAMKIAMDKNEGRKALQSQQNLDIPSIAIEEENNPKPKEQPEPALNKLGSGSLVSNADHLNKSPQGSKDEFFDKSISGLSKLKDIRKNPFGQLLGPAKQSSQVKTEKFADMLNRSNNIPATGKTGLPDAGKEASMQVFSYKDKIKNLKNLTAVTKATTQDSISIIQHSSDGLT